MVDLVSQYQRLKSEIDPAIQAVCQSASFIKGPAVQQFENNLAEYLSAKHVVGCANGTDALQIALMALDLQPGDEVIVPAFTYVATAEVIALLGLRPVMVDVDPYTFNIELANLQKVISDQTKAIVPVHLFGQCADMVPLIEFAKANNLYVIEDNAQAIGADFTHPDGSIQKAGTIGHIGCTSFFPAKNLGCYGDGGALITNDDALAEKIKMIANHGQSKRYYHDVVGCNSRLDSIQAAVLDIKLKYLNNFSEARRQVANVYDDAFASLTPLITPTRVPNSTHVFHQYTLQVKNGQRDALAQHLSNHDIPYGIYYPVPLYKQKAFSQYVPVDFELLVTEQLCDSVISLPIHTEMREKVQGYIIDCVIKFFERG